VAFRGQYEYSLDAKNRLNLPPKWRGQLSEGLVLVKASDPCIDLFTPEAFDNRVEEALKGKNSLSPEYRDITRYFVHWAFETELDSAGRIMVPPKLLEHAGITKNEVVGGSIGWAELWEPAAWATKHADLGENIGSLVEGLGHPS
jgi:MraZ protein